MFAFCFVADAQPFSNGDKRKCADHHTLYQGLQQPLYLMDKVYTLYVQLQ